MVVFEIILIVLIADFISGLFHWLEDAYGREDWPITTLDLGPADTDARYAWGANMAIRRSALERVGPFDVTLEHGGDEQEWQERLRAQTTAELETTAGA